MSVALHNSVRAGRSHTGPPVALQALIAIAVFTGFACAGCWSKSADRAADSATKPQPTEKAQITAQVRTSQAPSENAPASVPDVAGMPGKSLEASPAAPISTATATGDPAHDWALKYERTENGPDADLVVRTGDINNLGFGWTYYDWSAKQKVAFDPFSGRSTSPHTYPWKTPADEPAGTDRITLASVVTPDDWHNKGGDGYSGTVMSACYYASKGFTALQNGKPDPCNNRQASMPVPITLTLGALPDKINAVVFQIFADDFQAKGMGSHFQVSLNGTRIPSFEYAINSLDQSGPIGKLITLKLLPEYWPLLQTGTVKLLFDDPTTHVPDGYSVDFVRILVNPHTFKYQVSLAASVFDADTNKPIADAMVSAALESTATNRQGKCQLNGLPAGLVVATASAPGYDENSVPVDLIADQAGNAELRLHRHDEGTAALDRSIAQTGSATVYGIHFDTDSAKLRSDSLPALNAILGLVQNHASSHWLIAGHTDNQGSDARNQPLSEQRAAAVIAWLKDHGANASQLASKGFGATRPVADNATAGGRTLNRRVEVALTK